MSAVNTPNHSGLYTTNNNNKLNLASKKLNSLIPT